MTKSVPRSLPKEYYTRRISTHFTHESGIGCLTRSALTTALRCSGTGSLGRQNGLTLFVEGILKVIIFVLDAVGEN